MEASSDALTEMFLLLKGPANDLARQMVTSEQTTAIFMSSLEVCLRETRICSACQLDGMSEVRSNVKEARGHVQHDVVLALLDKPAQPSQRASGPIPTSTCRKRTSGQMSHFSHPGFFVPVFRSTEIHQSQEA